MRNNRGGFPPQIPPLGSPSPFSMEAGKKKKSNWCCLISIFSLFSAHFQYGLLGKRGFCQVTQFGFIVWPGWKGREGWEGSSGKETPISTSPKKPTPKIPKSNRERKKKIFFLKIQLLSLPTTGKKSYYKPGQDPKL